jgi:hypothetical protein
VGEGELNLGAMGREQRKGGRETKKAVPFYEPAQLFMKKTLIDFAMDTVPRWLFTLFLMSFHVSF